MAISPLVSKRHLQYFDRIGNYTARQNKSHNTTLTDTVFVTFKWLHNSSDPEQ
jgi:hypothetical protein